MKSLGAKLAIASFAFVCALAAAEVGLRVFRPVKFMRPETLRERDGWYGMIHRASTIEGLGYELVPNLDQTSMGVRVKTNSLGMRGDEPLPLDTPGLVRIIALGDSFAFGYRVEAQDNVCSQLARDLADAKLAAGARYEVLDTGVSGYSTRDEVIAFEAKWLALKPKLVLVCYVPNDPEIEPLQPLQRVFVAPHWWQHFDLCRFVAQWIQGRKIRELGGGNYYRFLHTPTEPSWRSVADGFAKLAELARRHDFKVALAIFPLFSPDPWSAYPLREVHAAVKREGERNGFAVVDLLATFEQIDPAELLIARDDIHPNARGHKLAADAIFALIREHPELVGAQ